jgi:Ca2+-binding RTX toxin-like protein
MSAFKSLDAGSTFAFTSQAYDTVTSHLQFGTTSLGSDIVFGGAGNDTIIGYGRGGPSLSAANSYAFQDKADCLDDGAGNDYILGAGDNDIVIGGAGNDVISSGSGDDLL